MALTDGYSIDLLIRRDQRAFQVFYQKHWALYYQFGLRFIDDSEAVRDVVQDAFIAMWDRLDSFQEETHIKAFLYTTIRNKSINYLRDRQVERKNQEKLLLLQNEAEFRNIALEEEMYDFLCKKIEMLPPMQREVLWMHIDGFSNEEIAEKLGVTVNTVLTHKQRAKCVLKKYLDAFSVFILVCL